MSAKRLLVVEDSRTQAEQLRSLLDEAGYTIDVAYDGLQAIAALEVHPADAVLSDIVMPGGVDGFELCRRIKAGPKADTAVVLLTSLSDPADIIQALECGADNFIRKPYEPSYLLERLRVLFTTRELRAKNRVSIGMTVLFMGHEITVDAGHQQVLDLLISTFEEAVLQNRQLRQSEEELRLAKAELDRYAGTLELRLQTVLDTIPDALFSVDASLGNLFYVSPAAVSVFGHTAEELTTDPQLWRRSIHPDDLAAVLDAFGSALESRTPRAVECRFQARQGDWRWLQLKVAAVAEGPQAGVRLDGVARDVTSRKREEENLRRMATVVRDSNDAITIQDFEGRITAWNRGAELMYGYGEEEALLVNIERLTTPGKVAEQKDFIRRLIAGEAITSFETQRVTKDGRILDVWMTVTKLMDDAGKPVGLASTERDITARKRAEDRIVHLNRILRAVRDVNQLIVRERDGQHLIENVCTLLVERRGYESAMIVLSEEAGVPRAWAEAGMGDAFQPLAESLRRGVMPPCCRLAQRQEGVSHVTDPAEVCSPCPIWAKADSNDAACIQLRHGETTYGYLAVSVDRMLGTDAEEDSLLCEVAGDVAYALHGIERAEAMTQVEEDRDRVTGELQQSQKLEAVGRLAGGVAHDFNNLLTVILTSCSFIEEELREADPMLEDIRTIREASQSAATLTRQLLAFSRRQVLQPQTLDLNALVGGLEKMLGRLLGEDIVVRFQAASDLGLVRADPGQIEQVIVNLAVNARDAMPEGGTLTLATEPADVSEEYAREHGGKCAGPYAKLTIADTGCGMDPDTLARAFEPFFTTKEAGKGTGLGLSTVYGIVQQSGGLIAVFSEVGRETTFSVYLPLAAPDVQLHRPAVASERPVARGETILLVEDSGQLRVLAARSLRKLGYRVFEASGLEEARRIAETERGIHLLLTDVVMPGGSGRAVADAALASHPGLKVLYMTGFTDDAIVQHHVLDQGVALLQKPFTPDSLGAKVREVLDAR